MLDLPSITGLTAKDVELLRERAAEVSKALADAYEDLAEVVKMACDIVGINCKEAADSLNAIFEAMEIQEEEKIQKLHPCPLKASQRPTTAMSAAPKRCPKTNRERPRARSTIRKRGNRRRW